MAQRKRTIRLYRIADDGRRLLADTLEVGSPVELVVQWRASSPPRKADALLTFAATPRQRPKDHGRGDYRSAPHGMSGWTG